MISHQTSYFAQQYLSGNKLPHVQTSGAVENGLTIFFVILGAIAFLMMVIGGFNMVLSQGNPDRVARARNTLIYAAVGLVIASSATLIVKVVLNRAAG